MAFQNQNDPSMVTIPGTRVLVETFGLVGCRFRDRAEPARNWVVLTTLQPLQHRSNRGIRVRVIDQLGFVSMVSQQDLDLLTMQAKPGSLCPWTSEPYPEIGDEQEGWRGLRMTEEDLEDDLHIRELELREQMGWGMLPELQLTRRIHTDGRDLERLDMLLLDYNPDTGVGPDPSLENIGKRWAMVQQEAIPWII